MEHHPRRNHQGPPTHRLRDPSFRHLHTSRPLHPSPPLRSPPLPHLPLRLKPLLRRRLLRLHLGLPFLLQSQPLPVKLLLDLRHQSPPGAFPSLHNRRVPLLLLLLLSPSRLPLRRRHLPLLRRTRFPQIVSLPSPRSHPRRLRRRTHRLRFVSPRLRARVPALQQILLLPWKQRLFQRSAP